MDAAAAGDLARVNQLLASGASVDEKDSYGASAVTAAIFDRRYATARWLFEVGGASITENDAHGNSMSVWDWFCLDPDFVPNPEISSLFKVMVMLSDPPVNFIEELSRHNAEIITRGRQLREQLPSFLEQQRASVIVHCPLPTVLQFIVAAYAVPTPEDMWTDGLN